MDHLGIDKFMVMGFCIGGPFIWNLLKRAPDRVVAAVLAQPSGFRPEMPTLTYDGNMTGWGPELVKRRPDITMDTVQKFLTKMYRNNPDFVFTVTRDFVRNCQTPVLILPDDIPAHPYAVAMEAAMLAPKAEVSMFPWKEPKERIPLAVRQIRSFLKAHRPGSITGTAAQAPAASAAPTASATPPAQALKTPLGRTRSTGHLDRRNRHAFCSAPPNMRTRNFSPRRSGPNWINSDRRCSAGTSVRSAGPSSTSPAPTTRCSCP